MTFKNKQPDKPVGIFAEIETEMGKYIGESIDPDYLVRERLHLVLTKASSSITDQEPIKPGDRRTCVYQDIQAYPGDEFVMCDSPEKCEFQTPSSVPPSIYCNKDVISYDMSIETAAREDERKRTGILARDQTNLERTEFLDYIYSYCQNENCTSDCGGCKLSKLIGIIEERKLKSMWPPNTHNNVIVPNTQGIAPDYRTRIISEKMFTKVMATLTRNKLMNVAVELNEESVSYGCMNKEEYSQKAEQHGRINMLTDLIAHFSEFDDQKRFAYSAADIIEYLEDFKKLERLNNGEKI
jgi:hypothetical protein